MPQYRQRFGHWAEELTCRYLVSHQYRIIDRHWQRRPGEIDIVAFDQAANYLVFVEVRATTSDAYGRPEESISRRKKRSLARIIAFYVQERGYRGFYRCDVCALARRPGRPVSLRHLKNVSLE
jgi:putative endonuclease